MLTDGSSNPIRVMVLERGRLLYRRRRLVMYVRIVGRLSSLLLQAIELRFHIFHPHVQLVLVGLQVLNDSFAFVVLCFKLGNVVNRWLRQ